MGLSSNVLNMKFMQNSKSKKTEETEVKKVKDSSEWSLPGRSVKPFKAPISIKTVGYGSIASLTAKDDINEEKSLDNTQEKNPKPDKITDAQDFLSGILNKAKRDKKRSHPNKNPNPNSNPNPNKQSNKRAKKSS